RIRGRGEPLERPLEALERRRVGESHRAARYAVRKLLQLDDERARRQRIVSRSIALALAEQILRLGLDLLDALAKFGAPAFRWGEHGHGRLLQGVADLTGE